MEERPDKKKAEKDAGEVVVRTQSKSEFETTVEIEKDNYFVQTEDLDKAAGEIVTNTYLGGRIVSSIKTASTGMGEGLDRDKKLRALMLRQHQAAVEIAREKSARPPSEYYNEVNTLLRRKNKKGALALLREASEFYGEDPMVLSYLGCMVAEVEKEYETGAGMCKKAVENLAGAVPFGQDFIYPALYLNLGKAYLAGGKKQDAVKAFEKGLTYDPLHKELLWEKKKLGERKKPPVGFLSRSNPINRYLGKLRSRMKKD